VSTVRADDEENDDADCSGVHRGSPRDKELVTWSEAKGVRSFPGVVSAVVKL
jgi:hypothetical protein